MRMAPIISLVLSIVVGFIAVFFGRGWLNSEAEATNVPAAVVVEEVATQRVLVADLLVERGDILTIESFRETDWPADHLPEGAVTDVNDILSVDGEFPFALGVMVPGEPLLRGKLSHTAVRDTLAGVIEPGYRAVSVQVNDASGVAGFVLPDHRVDVNVFYESNDPVTGRLTNHVRTLLQDVRVLAVDQKFQEGLEGASPSNTVTLQVTPQQAKAVGLAAETSKIGLVLRPKGEVSLETPKRRPAPKPVVKASPKPAKKFTTIRVIQGDSEQTISAPIVSAETKDGASD